MSQDQSGKRTDQDDDHGSVVRECPHQGCGWQIKVDKMYPEDETARDEAECHAERHFDREHRGEARVRVVLEREVSAHPEQTLQDIIDSEHDRLAEDTPAGFEVAFAYGELLEEPDT